MALISNHQRLKAFNSRANAQHTSVKRVTHQSLNRISSSRFRTNAIELDFSDPDTQLSCAGLLLGVIAGLGAPLWYINRTEKDQERLEELRALNRATYQETGEYMSEDEIAKFRKPKWTDRKEWVDDD